MTDRLEKVRREAFSAMKNDAAHDSLHIMRVYKNAELLCRGEGMDSEPVLASVLLHDLVSFKKSDPENAAAADKSAAEAAPILRRSGYGDGEVSVICDAIRDHSFSRGIVPKTDVGRILQDADRLDAIGAVGIARVFAVGGSEGRPMYNSDDPFCTARDPDDARWTVDHFYQKLLKLGDSMNTETGRSLARDRAKILLDFLAQLRREL